MAEMDLTKKVGPLPLGVWLIVVAGGFGLAYYINSRGSTGGTGGGVVDPGSGVGGGGIIPSPPTTEEPIDERIKTNADWGRRVLNWLISEGKDPGDSDQMVRRYLAGMPMQNLSQVALRNLALGKFGAPPEPIQPVVDPEPEPPPAGQNPPTGLTFSQIKTTSFVATWVAPTGAVEYEWKVDGGFPTHRTTSTTVSVSGGIHAATRYTVMVRARNAANVWSSWTSGSVTTASASTPSPPTQPPPPPPPRTYTVVVGDVLSVISLRFYGTANRWMEIYNANAGEIEAAARRHGRSSSRGGPRNEVGWYIYPGTVLRIP